MRTTLRTDERTQPLRFPSVFGLSAASCISDVLSLPISLLFGVWSNLDSAVLEILQKIFIHRSSLTSPCMVFSSYFRVSGLNFFWEFNPRTNLFIWTTRGAGNCSGNFFIWTTRGAGACTGIFFYMDYPRRG